MRDGRAACSVLLEVKGWRYEEGEGRLAGRTAREPNYHTTGDLSANMIVHGRKWTA